MTEITEAPSLVGVHTRLQAVSPGHYEFLFYLATDSRIAFDWRFRGLTPSPDQFSAALWNGVLAQFVVVSAETSQPVGHVAAYNADLRNGTIWMAAAVTPDLRGQGWPLEGMALLVRYLLRGWPIRRVFMEMLSFNDLANSQSIRRIFREEGRLRDYEYFDGRYWDKVMLAADAGDLDVALKRLGLA